MTRLATAVAVAVLLVVAGTAAADAPTATYGYDSGQPEEHAFAQGDNDHDQRGDQPAESTQRASAHAYDDRSQVARSSARLNGHGLAPNTARGAGSAVAKYNFGNYGGEFLDDAIRSPVVRPDLGNLSSKIKRQMGTRGWTPDLIDEAVQQGRAFPAVNKLGGANTPATRYVHPGTGQSVVIDNATGQVIQVGGPLFRY